MKKRLKSLDSNSKRQVPATPAVLIAATLLCVAFASTTEVFAQRRLNRPPGRDVEGTQILPAGTSVIPDGTILIVEIDSKINSGTAQVSDRFLARIATPIVDERGRTLLQAGTLIEGHVANVKKAKWGHRSGELELSFDYIALGDGRNIPLRGEIVGGTNPIDEEGNLKAKSAIKRDALVTTGGAVAGAGVGMVTGATILAGGGVGAAAGLTVVLVMKGKDVDIDRGERFNLQLAQPVNVNPPRNNVRVGVGSNRFIGSGPIRTPVPLQPRGSAGGILPGGYSPGSQSYSPGSQSYGNPNSVRTPWSRVPVYDVRAERDRDGMLRVQVTAQTQTGGWRIYTNHEVQPRDTLDIRLMGVPPSEYGQRQIMRPTASTICVEDRNSDIRRIVVRGSNGDKTLQIGKGAASARLDQYAQSFPSEQQQYRAPQTSQQRRTSYGSLNNFTIPPTTANTSGSTARSTGSTARSTGLTGGSTAGSTVSAASLARETANHLETLRANYAATVGLWIDTRTGAAESNGGRNATPSEKQLYDQLLNMENSARAMSSPSLDSSNRQRYLQRLRSDAQNAQQNWQKAQSSGIITRDLERQWQITQNDLRSLINTASR